MFGTTQNSTTLSEERKHFTCSNIRKKGRSLSQTSFLFTNLIPFPQKGFPLAEQKKTLAFAPSSFKWTQSQTSEFTNKDYSEWANNDCESSQICSTTDVVDKFEQKLFFTKNRSQSGVFQDESWTYLSSSYKYNPIFPQNQLYADNSIATASSHASYTSIKHHILENIPLNLISNLNILLNKTHNESLISSKSSFCLVNDVISKTQIGFSEISESDAKHNCRRPNSSKNLANNKTCQFSFFKNGKGNSFMPSSSYLHTDIKRRKSETNLFLRGSGEHQSSIFSQYSQSSQQDQLIVLKPASDSVATSCSSESIISSLELACKHSETTLELESIQTEENDLKVHYINKSASDESEYSLLVSKGYTFVDTTSRQDPSSESNFSETELRVVNFSESNFNPRNKVSHQNKDSSSGQGKNFTCPSQTDFEYENFKSCHSTRKSQLEFGDLEKHSQLSSRSSSKVKDKFELKTVRRQKPPLVTSKEENFFKKGSLRKVENISRTSETVHHGKLNKSLRNTVKKISERFMRFESPDCTNDDSSSETYTENISSQEQFSTSGEDSEKFDFEDYPFNYDSESTNYTPSIQEPKPKVTQKMKQGLKIDFCSKQKSASFRSHRNSNNSRNNVPKSYMLPRKKRKNTSVSSQSTLIVRRRHSKHSLTSNSTYHHIYKGQVKKGVLKRGCSRKEKKFGTGIVLSTGHEKSSAKSTIFSENDKWLAGDAEVTSRSQKKIEKSMNYDHKLLNVTDEKNLQIMGSKKEITNFVGKTEIVNLNEPREHKKNNKKISPRDVENQNTGRETPISYKQCEKTVFEKRKIKPEMDVYTKSDRKSKVLKNERGLSEKFVTPKEKIVEIMDNKQHEKVRSDKRIQNLVPKKNDSTKEHTTQSTTEQEDSFHSCWKENSFTASEKQAELQNRTKNRFRKARVCTSNNSSSSALASSYFPQDEKSTIDSSGSEQSISETTTEYIKWAKNCLLNQSKERQETDNESSQLPKTGYKAYRDRDLSFDLQDRSSIASEECITVMNISVCDEIAETSDGSISAVENTSALSVIPEENGSTEKLKTPFVSQKSSAVIKVSKHKSSNSRKLSLKPKLVSSSQDSLNDVISEENTSLEEQKLSSPNTSAVTNVPKGKSSDSSKCFEPKFNISSEESLSKRGSSGSARTTKSWMQKNKSKRFLLSSESEGDYSKFKNELKFYHKKISSQNLPRIIPSSSTFTPDKSTTQISSKE